MDIFVNEFQKQEKSPPNSLCTYAAPTGQVLFINKRVYKYM